MAYFVVLIETASNQRTIFQTNRQRENLGASELIYHVGTRYVLEALGVGQKSGGGSDPWRLDKFLLDQAENPPIEGSPSDDAVEIVIATSGKAVLIVRSKERGQKIIADVTRRTLIESPGVTARGALAEVSPTHEGKKPTAHDIDDAIYRAHLRHETLGALLPSADLRFPRLPFVEDCASSGLPAADVWSKTEPKGAVAETLKARRDAHKEAVERMSAALTIKDGRSGEYEPPRLPTHDELERNYDWTAVVHADGNGLGAIFLNFADTAFKNEDASVPGSFRAYIDRLRRFSIGIDQCTRKAARRAIEETWKETGNEPVPIIPLVLGGDDLTVLCDGSKAIPFTVSFLKAFEDETKRWRDVKAVAPDGLSACAGIAIVKPHFPFHRAYELAEDLIKSAKEIKKKAKRADDTPVPCSAFDFQIVFDTSTKNLGEIRTRMTVRDDTSSPLTFRPYVVSEAGRWATLDGKDWLDQHHFDRLEECKLVLQKPAKQDEPEGRNGGLALPHNQQHMLRWALQQGKAIADARLAEIRHRYELPWNSLFVKAEDEDGERTYLLDAMDLADLEAAGKKSGGVR